MLSGVPSHLTAISVLCLIGALFLGCGGDSPEPDYCCEEAAGKCIPSTCPTAKPQAIDAGAR